MLCAGPQYCWKHPPCTSAIQGPPAGTRTWVDGRAWTAFPFMEQYRGQVSGRQRLGWGDFVVLRPLGLSVQW